VTRKKSAREKWPREILEARTDFVILDLLIYLLFRFCDFRFIKVVLQEEEAGSLSWWQ